jgi:hypothetical protein
MVPAMTKPCKGVPKLPKGKGDGECPTCGHEVSKHDLEGKLAEEWSDAARKAAIETRKAHAHKYGLSLGAKKVEFEHDGDGIWATLHHGGGVSNEGFGKDPVEAVHNAHHGDPEDRKETGMGPAPAIPKKYRQK